MKDRARVPMLISRMYLIEAPYMGVRTYYGETRDYIGHFQGEIEYREARQTRQSAVHSSSGTDFFPFPARGE